jgi:acetyl esterase/lipase
MFSMKSPLIISAAIAITLTLSSCASMTNSENGEAKDEAPQPPTTTQQETAPDAETEPEAGTGTSKDLNAGQDSDETSDEDTTATEDSVADDEPAKEETESNQPQTPDLRTDLEIASVEIQKDITYTSAATGNGNVDLELDMYLPIDSAGEPIIANRPAVVLVHGGGFILGSKEYGPIGDWATKLAEAGYPTAAINYRLILSDPKVTNPNLIEYLQEAQPTAALPEEAPDQAITALRVALGAAMEDTNAAIEYMVSQGAHPEHIAVGGESAGAITSIHLGFLNNDLSLGWKQPAAVLNLWGGFSEDTENPDLGIDSNDPALWTMHGTNDNIVDYASAEYLKERTDASGTPHTFYSIEGAGHGFAATGFLTDPIPGADTTYIEDQISFLNQNLLEG